MEKNKIINTIAKELASIGVSSFFVGGCVRDHLMGLSVEDVDICLVGANDIEPIEAILNKHSKCSERVGNSFPVWIVTIGGEKFDFALARCEKKSGNTRKDFSVETENVTIEEDLKRRDITVNAIAQNILTDEIVDPFGGIGDIHSGLIRHVSDAFGEDPLRVYRVARFAARFGFKIAPETITLMSQMEHTGISPERVGMELKKAMVQSKTPSVFFETLREIGWLKYHFAPLEALIGIEQDPQWHPEGCAFRHTMCTLDQANDLLTRVTMVCHDLGKATTTVFRNGHWTSPGHAAAGAEPTRAMLMGIKLMDNHFIDQVVFLVKHHMIHTETPISKKRVMRLMREMEKIGLEYENLVEVCRCDHSGRPPIAPETPEIGQEWLEDIRTNNLNKVIVTGNMLLQLGFQQGKELGDELKKLRDLQDSGILNWGNWMTFVGK